MGLLSKERAVVMMVASAQKPDGWGLHLVAGPDQGCEGFLLVS